MLLGYDDLGHCPMLRNGACSIYDHRPKTCRTYDCRVFPAAAVQPDKPAIAARAGQWRFAYPTDDDRAQHDAVRAVAEPDEPNPTRRAVNAVMDGYPKR